MLPSTHTEHTLFDPTVFLASSLIFVVYFIFFVCRLGKLVICSDKNQIVSINHWISRSFILNYLKVLFASQSVYHLLTEDGMNDYTLLVDRQLFTYVV